MPYLENHWEICVSPKHRVASERPQARTIANYWRTIEECGRYTRWKRASVIHRCWKTCRKTRALGKPIDVFVAHNGHIPCNFFASHPHVSRICIKCRKYTRDIDTNPSGCWERALQSFIIFFQSTKKIAIAISHQKSASQDFRFFATYHVIIPPHSPKIIIRDSQDLRAFAKQFSRGSGNFFRVRGRVSVKVRVRVRVKG